MSGPIALLNPRKAALVLWLVAGAGVVACGALALDLARGRPAELPVRAAELPPLQAASAAVE
ncbi:MAG: hypothetical protein AMK73_08070, partial [Planctomycetes bacterium SM23_32]